MNSQIKVADITLQQLGGGSRLKAMIGAKHIYCKDEGKTLMFKFMRGVRNKANYIEVTLAADDTYTVKFFSLYTTRNYRTDFKAISEHAQVYCDQLRGLFETETGLYLSL